MATTLSDGSLDTILASKNTALAPVVQILCCKTMSNNRVRAVIYDGRTLFQHCIIVKMDGDEEEMKDNKEVTDDEEISKFTVVRLDEYAVSAMPKKENMLVLLVSKMTVLKHGKLLSPKFFISYLKLIFLPKAPK